MVNSIRVPFFILLVLFPSRIHAYPTAVSLTNDAALAEILADIPLVSVGLVGFAVYTFFFVMRRLNKVTIIIHISVVLAFVAAIFDLSQILRRGYWETMMNLNISSVQTLIIFREISHSLSFATRYLFFWAFVAEPPRGELPFVPMQDDRRPNFISLSSESVLHSGDWARLKLFGIFLKWALLLLVVTVATLQILWRLVNAFKTYGPVYATEAGIEIGLSVAFILKLLVNTVLSPLSPRWHTVRDYSPVIAAILFGMGVAIGNLLCFKFTETTLGRFFQAIEFYILILFVLISAFYKMPVRSSVVAELVRRRLTAAGFGDIENTPSTNMRQSQISIVQAPYLMPPGMGESRGNNDKGQDAPRASFTQRISSNSMFSSLMSRRGGSGQMRTLGNQVTNDSEGDQRRLWNRDNPSPSSSPGGQRSFRASLEQTPEQTPTVAMRDAPGWKDPVLTSVIPQTNAGVSNAAPATPLERNSASPRIVVADDASVYTADRYSSPAPPQLPYSRNDAESPVYGLDGIIRNLQQANNAIQPEESDINTERSSGIESLLRQQAELDKSIAGLRRFSTTSTTRLPPSRMQSSSLQSDISLSNFPEPPTFAKSFNSEGSDSIRSTLRAIDEDVASVPETVVDRSKSMAISAISDNSMVVDDVPFQLVPPRMPAVMAETSSRQNPSVPSISRESLDSVLAGSEPGRTVRMDSQGTQYDVTSFIGGLTAPAQFRDSPQLSDISERDRSSDTDSGSNVPVTISDVTRVQVIDQGRPSEESVPDSGIGHSDTAQQLFVPPLPAMGQTEGQSSMPQTQAQNQPQVLRPQLPTSTSGNKAPVLGKGRGLPGGPRGRLEISNPIRQASDIINERTFQRPRPAPLVLQNANDARPAIPEVPRNGGYF